MPIGLGIGVSHAPGMYMHTEEQWNGAWDRISLARGVPQPASVAEETGEKLQDIVDRIQAGHAELKRQFLAYDPDVVIIIGGDQTEMFDRSNVPQFMVYLGERGAGRRPGSTMSKPGEVSNLPPVELDIDVEFSTQLLTKLVKQEHFDISFSHEMKNLGRHHGLPHAFVYPTSWLFDGANKPTVVVYENTFDAPSLSAKRCYELGAALARITKNDPRRIAILGSGGLAHDPGGKRSGWLDPALDRWFLDQLAQGKGKATQAMYTFNSDAMVGARGKTGPGSPSPAPWRKWARARPFSTMSRPPRPATGLGFAYWPVEPKYAAIAAE